ncbi:unnamed protein product [Auanema sp. JU1783]|nr:unnamed protein product [Auanema sp. JU1783]
MFLGLIAAILLVVLHFAYQRRRNLKTLARSGVPIIPSDNVILGNLKTFISSTSVFDYGLLSKKYGRSFGMMLGIFPVIVTNDIDVIHDICVKHYDHFHAKMTNPLDPDPIYSTKVHMFNATGERWKRMRAVTSRAVSANNMKELFEIVKDSTVCFIDFVNEMIYNDNDVAVIDNSHRLFQNHTSDVLSRCVFGQKTSIHKKNTYLNLFYSVFGERLRMDFSKNTLSWSFPAVMRLYDRFASCVALIKERVTRFKPQNAQFFELLHVLYLSHEAGNQKFDFLQFFKNAEKFDDALPLEKKFGRVDFSKTAIQHVLLKQEVLAQCRFISIAGFDTTANTLSFLLYLLANNTHCKTRLEEEIENCEHLNYHALSSLKFLHNCILETLRLYPHASPLHQRRCMESIKINDVQFEKGMNVIVDTWSIHRNRQIWGENASTFCPDRFECLTEKQKKAFMPFGLGPRQCIGMRFALMEMKTTIFYFLKSFNILTQSSKICISVRDTGTVWPDEIPIALKKKLKNDV